MARKKSKYPTELELEILKILWEAAPLAVREVRELMAERGRKLAHTSTNVQAKSPIEKRAA